MSLETLKHEVSSVIDALRPELIAANHAIHAHPELAFEEISVDSGCQRQ